MPNELKACPWCGSKVTKMTDADRVSAMRDYYCPGCKVSVTWFQTEVGQTDDLWNTRPAAPVPTAGGGGGVEGGA